MSQRHKFHLTPWSVEMPHDLECDGQIEYISSSGRPESVANGILGISLSIMDRELVEGQCHSWRYGRNILNWTAIMLTVPFTSSVRVPGI